MKRNLHFAYTIQAAQPVEVVDQKDFSSRTPSMQPEIAGSVYSRSKHCLPVYDTNVLPAYLLRS